MSKQRNMTAARRREKCTFCESDVYGNPNQLQKHMFDHCKHVTGEQKFQYLKIMSKKHNKSIPTALNPSETFSSAGSLAKGLKITHNFSNSSLHHLRTRDQENTDEIYEDIFLALINGQIPFGFLQNQVFQPF